MIRTTAPLRQDDLEDFFLQQKKQMSLPEEDVASYVARRAAMRHSSMSILGKHRIESTLEETPIARKKSRKLDPVKNVSTKISSRAQPKDATVEAVASTMYQLAAEPMIVDDPVVEDKVRSRTAQPPATSRTKPFKTPISTGTKTKAAEDVNRKSPTAPVPPTSSCVIEIPNSTSSTKSKLTQKESIIAVSHHRSSPTRRTDRVIKIPHNKEEIVADTSNITTPASTPVPAAKVRAPTTRNAVAVARSSRVPLILNKVTVQKKTPEGMQAVPEVESSKTRAIISKPEPKKKAAKPKPPAKVKPVPMTPAAYADHLITKYAGTSKLNAKDSQFLRGTTIFYATKDLKNASESTRKRLEFIVKRGGALASAYDASVVTHVVTEAGERGTARQLGLKSIMEIPNHIPTVKWSWVQAGTNLPIRRKLIEAGAPPGTLGEQLPVKLPISGYHAAFDNRFQAGDDYDWGSKILSNKGKEKEKPAANVDHSRISEFTDDPNDSDYRSDASELSIPVPVKKYTGTSSSVIQTAPAVKLKSSSSIEQVSLIKALSSDPLAEFYEQAKEELEHGVEDSDCEEVPPPQAISVSKMKGKNWVCDRKGGELLAPSPNQDIVAKLKELQGLYQAKPGEENQWRVFSYNKCLRSILAHPTRIKSYAEARTIKHVGHKTALKIMEIIHTGALKRIGYENTEDVRTNMLFQGIFGVGLNTACVWYANGARTLEDVVAGKGGIKLTSAQEIGIRYYDEINERMPRSEAEAIFKKIEKIALKIDPKLSIQIMGSFRRGATTCGDIDVMITRPTDDGKTHAGAVYKIWAECHTQGVLTDDLVMPDSFNDLELVYRGLCRKDAKSKRRRIDFLSIPYHMRGAALLYYTGDAIFNRSLRLKARRNGMSLNQRGLYGSVIRDLQDPSVKTNEGQLLACETEKEILDILEVPWQEPHERVRANVV